MPYIQNALTFTIETILGIYLIAVILRFLFALLRVDFRNPISQLIFAVTNPPLKFLRRFIPGLYGIDLSAVVLILVVGIIKTGLLVTISGIPPNVPGIVVITVAEVLNTVTWTFIVAILGSAVLSWVAPMTQHPAAQLVNGISYPVLKPFRKILPAFQGIDLSPILALITLNLIQRLVVHPISDLGRSLFF
jgi:YggT family protein